MIRMIALSIFICGTALAVECPDGLTSKKGDTGEGLLHSWCEKDGKREGPYEVFSLEKGRLIEARFFNDKLNGPFRRFYSEGKIETQGVYKDGQMSGPWKRFNEDGKLADEGKWSADLPEGKWRKFGENGKTNWLGEYKAGKLVSEKKLAKRSTKYAPYRFYWTFGLFDSHVDGDNNSGNTGGGPGGNNSSSDDKHETNPAIGLGWHWNIIKNIDLNLFTEFSSVQPANREGSKFTTDLGLKFDFLGYWLFPISLGVLGGAQSYNFESPVDFFGLELSYNFKERHFLGFNRIFFRHMTVSSDEEDPGPNTNTNPNGPSAKLSQVFLGVAGAF